MKKIFALLALVLGVVSCQTEPEGLDVNVGGEQEVAICVSLPEATRANADSALGAFDNVDLGTEADTKTIRYILKIYQKVGENYVASTDRQVEYSDEKSVVFPVRLVPNRDYRFVVWADYVESKNDTDLHYNTKNEGELANITLNGEWNPMDETRDAFTGYFDTFKEGEQYTSTSSINITLKRPFAKLRVITTDMKELDYLGIEPPFYAEVEYATEYRAGFNAFESKAFGAGSEKKSHSVFRIADYNDNVDKKSKVLFTDYFFAEDDVVKFTLSVYEDQAKTKPIKSNFFNTDIAAKRNYLTTIAGNILTDGNNITVEVKDAFENANYPTDEPYYYQTISSEAELLAAINNGGEYVVISDIEVNGLSISAQAATRSGVTTTINLNGYTINLQENIVIPEGNTLIINNDPVDDAGNDEGAIVSENGKAIINNGTLNIEGGNFGENTIVNNGKVNVNGGDVDDAITNGEDAIVGSFIYNIDQLKEAVKNAVENTANEFTLAADIKGDVVVVIQKPNVKITINGANHKFNGYFKVHSNSNHYATAAVTFKDINFETSTASVNFIEALEKGAERYSTNITIEGCTFTATGDAVNTAVGASVKATRNFVMNGCEGNNLHSLLQANSCDVDCPLVITNCKAIDCKGGISFTQVLSSVVENVEIDALGYGIRYDGRVDNYGITVKNCDVTAAQPFIVRKMTGKNNTITLEGENTFTTDEYFKIVITNGSDDEAYVAPTGTYTLTGAEAYNVFPDYVNIATEAELKDAFALGIRNISLNADIALTEAWTPVGNAEKPWYGVFDGKDHKISGLSVEGIEYAAFISHSAANSTVKNLTLENVNLDSTKHAAGVVCVAGEGLTLENITVNGKIKAVSYAGGIVHNGANATIKNCQNYASINAGRAGGIASYLPSGAIIDNVINHGNITGIGAAGIVHSFGGYIKNAVNYGDITSYDLEPAAGIACKQTATSTYEYCYNYGDVTSTLDNANSSASGILGHTPGSTSTIKYCANYGDIVAENSYAAGIAYSLYGSINASYCYNNGAVYGGDGAGAIAPKAQYGAGDKASYCLNAGVITSGGKVYQGSNNNVSCFYYNNGELYNVKDNTVADVDAALALLNGGDDAEFFTLVDGIISVVIE